MLLKCYAIAFNRGSALGAMSKYPLNAQIANKQLLVCSKFTFSICLKAY